MAIWNVLIKDEAGETDEVRAERALFVRERPFLLVFLFPTLGLLRFRLWLALVGYLVLGGILVGLDALLSVPQAVEIAAAMGLNLLVCLELSTLRLRKARRLGYREAGVVSAPTRDEAERRFFKSYTFASLPEVVVPRPRRGGYTAPGFVIGSFPEPRTS
ncbi:MAG: hypothetical protein B7Y70_08915 [Rhizobiales bacterium 35-68-8]|nr:MAG: hypothetical protein B7Y70_08915 [Rhizobiales bacterium 35-68-8]